MTDLRRPKATEAPCPICGGPATHVRLSGVEMFRCKACCKTKSQWIAVASTLPEGEVET